MPKLCQYDGSQHRWPFLLHSRFHCHLTGVKNGGKIIVNFDERKFFFFSQTNKWLTAHVPKPIAGIRFPSLKWIYGTFVLFLAIFQILQMSFAVEFYSLRWMSFRKKSQAWYSIFSDFLGVQWYVFEMLWFIITNVYVLNAFMRLIFSSWSSTAASHSTVIVVTVWQKPVNHRQHTDYGATKKKVTKWMSNQVSMSCVADVIIMTKYGLAFCWFADNLRTRMQTVTDRMYVWMFLHSIVFSC